MNYPGCDSSILLYGDSGDGKTALIGEYAKDRFIRSKGKAVTRLYAGDPGGFETVKHLQPLGILDIIDLRGLPFPWEWTDAVAKGKIYQGGRWVLDEERNANVSAWAFEGGTAFGEILLKDAVNKARRGVQVGGEAAPMFVERAAEGSVEGFKVFGNGRAHYGQVQTQLTAVVTESFYLPGMVIWTCTARRAGDNDNTQAIVLGPQWAGAKMTSEAPRWFVYTMRITSEPANNILNTSSKHKLILEDHTDMTTIGSKGLGNNRLPLEIARAEGPKIKMEVEPASIVKALELLQGLSKKAEGIVADEVRAALGKDFKFKAVGV